MANTFVARAPSTSIAVVWLAPLGLAGVFGVAATAIATSPTMALVLVAGALGTAGLATALVLTRRVPDLLLLAAIGCIALPLDKYFAFREHVGGWPGLRLSAADLALIALLPVVALGAWLGRVRNALPATLLVVYALWVLQYGVSLLGASRQDLAALEIASALHALFTALIVGALFRRDLLKPAVALLALQVLLHTGVAVAQAITGRPVGAGWFHGTSIVPETLETGVVRIRPSGLFDHPIVYADMLLLSLPVLFAGLFMPGGRLWRLGLGAALVIGVVGLGLTLSRGAWISTVIAGGVLCALACRHRLLTRRQLKRVAAAVAIAAVVLLPFLAPRAYERLVSSNEGNLRVRFELNWIALSMIEANPFAGVGLSNFIPVMEHYDPTNVMRYFPATVHNLYLLEGAEAGLPGMLLCLLVFGTVLTAGSRRLKQMREVGDRWVAAALIAGLAGFVISQLADFSHRLEPLRSLIWMNVGLLFALQRPDPRVKPGAPR